MTIGSDSITCTCVTLVRGVTCSWRKLNSPGLLPWEPPAGTHAVIVLLRNPRAPCAGFGRIAHQNIIAHRPRFQRQRQGRTPRFGDMHKHIFAPARDDHRKILDIYTVLGGVRP
jgi:hypothetical protein